LITQFTLPTLFFLSTVILVVNITGVSVVAVVILATVHTLISRSTSIPFLLWLPQHAKSISLVEHSAACYKQLPQGLNKNHKITAVRIADAEEQIDLTVE
jgi:hypothetical protein